MLIGARLLHLRFPPLLFRYRTLRHRLPSLRVAERRRDDGGNRQHGERRHSHELPSPRARRRLAACLQQTANERPAAAIANAPGFAALGEEL